MEAFIGQAARRLNDLQAACLSHTAQAMNTHVMASIFIHQNTYPYLHLHLRAVFLNGYLFLDCAYREQCQPQVLIRFKTTQFKYR